MKSIATVAMAALVALAATATEGFSQSITHKPEKRAPLQGALGKLFDNGKRVGARGEQSVVPPRDVRRVRDESLVETDNALEVGIGVTGPQLSVEQPQGGLLRSTPRVTRVTKDRSGNIVPDPELRKRQLDPEGSLITYGIAPTDPNTVIDFNRPIDDGQPIGNRGTRDTGTVLKFQF